MDTEDKKTNSQENNEEKIETLEEIIYNKCSSIIEGYKLNATAAKEIITTSVVSAQEFSRPLWRLYNALSQKCPTIFQIIDAELFLRIINHIRSIGYQKIENRNVGLSITIFSQEKEMDHSYKDYELQPISIERDQKIADVQKFFEDKGNELKRAYKGIDSQKAFFAFVYDKDNKSLKFKGIRKIDADNFEKICGDSAVGFQISEGIPCVRIYHRRNHILDYIISESTGDWVIRIKDDIKNVLKNNLELSDNYLDMLTEIIMQLSYLRIGSMLIITESPEQFKTRISSHQLNEAPLEDYFENGLIYQYAADDGAVIIQLQNDSLKVCYNGAVLNPQNNGCSKEYNDLIMKSNCGTRHEKAARHACENQDDCIIVISENRSISILHGSQPIYWRDDPNPLKK